MITIAKNASLVALTTALALTGCATGDLPASSGPDSTTPDRGTLRLMLHDDPTDEVDEVSRTILTDAQTSGGLLAAVPAGQADDVCAAWAATGYPASVIGVIEPASDKLLSVEA